jgi:hypothetical protein
LATRTVRDVRLKEVRVARQHPWLFVTFGIVVVIGIGGFLAGERGRGAFLAVMGGVGLWQTWVVSGGGRMRPSPRLVALAKHVPLLILLCVGGIWVVATGIVHVTSGQPGEGWLRIAFGVSLVFGFLFVLRRAFRNFG